MNFFKGKVEQWLNNESLTKMSFFRLPECPVSVTAVSLSTLSGGPGSRVGGGGHRGKTPQHPGSQGPQGSRMQTRPQAVSTSDKENDFWVTGASSRKSAVGQKRHPLPALILSIQYLSPVLSFTLLLGSQAGHKLHTEANIQFIH